MKRENENAAANKVKSAERNGQPAQKTVKEKAEREQARADQRVRVAKQKQAEKQKDKVTAREERKRLQAQRRALKEERKKDKAERKRLIREQRQTLRLERKAKRRASKGYGGWLAAVVGLGVLTLAMGSYLIADSVRSAPLKRAVAGTYQKSYYDFVRYVDNLDVSMSKLTVSESRAEQIGLLSDVHAKSLLAVSDAETLPLEDEQKFGTIKFINQLGDYAKSLETKLAKGGALEKEDEQKIERLYESMRSIKTALNGVSDSMKEGYDFLKFGKNGKTDGVAQGFQEMENNATNYPTMIYDGPFSDGQKTSKVKGLSGEEITAATAEEIFRSAFSEYQLKSVSVLGEASGKIAAYNVEAKLEDGTVLFAQVSRTGGKLLMFELYDACTEIHFDRDQCIEIALGFLAGQGIANVKPVWGSEVDTTVTINFAYVQDDIVCYSDLVKVDVCTQKGRVTGMEAVSYYTNHVPRKIPKIALRADEAKKSVHKIEQETCRLALIPVGGEEKLAYEISGTHGENTYYVYVDALTMEQIQTFRVVKTTEGDLIE
jgi:spore germination protein